MEQLIENYVLRTAKNTGTKESIVRNVLRLHRDGATIPFIARYRKEMTQSLDEQGVESVIIHYKEVQELEKRKEYVLSVIEEDGKLTQELRTKIEQCQDSNSLEDLYLPFKKKIKTKATVAREAGLEPLAEVILLQHKIDLNKEVGKYLNDKVPNIDVAITGAKYIIAEVISEDAKIRQVIRSQYVRFGHIQSGVVKSKISEAAHYKDYFEFDQKLEFCPSHRILAIFRGEDEGYLRIKWPMDEERLVGRVEKYYLKGDTECTQIVQECIVDALKRLIIPSMETEIRNTAKEKADAEAIEVFSDNLRQLLLAPPLGNRALLALDPGFRTGCKTVCLSNNGELLSSTAIYPHPPQNSKIEALETLKYLLKEYNIDTIAIGDGTAGKQTYQWLKKEFDKEKYKIYLVNESGASIYSASEIARQEFPNEDITVRGAVSIGRRLMDPLAELVKIDPKSIGVGQYQHDVNQRKLRDKLDLVVGYAVNSVGVNVNTASEHLLQHIAGLGPGLAKNIINYRNEKGQITSRIDLKNVPRLGKMAFQQCTGFLRVIGSEHPLDNTAVHPESYPIVEKMAKDLGQSLSELVQNPSILTQLKLANYVTETVGLPTLNDILEAIKKKGLDPRGMAKNVQFNDGIESIKDLMIGLQLNGRVKNITNFGAFVDLGIKENGLLHISQFKHHKIQIDSDLLVEIIDIDIERKRINLSVINIELNH